MRRWTCLSQAYEARNHAATIMEQLAGYVPNSLNDALAKGAMIERLARLCIDADNRARVLLGKPPIAPKPTREDMVNRKSRKQVIASGTLPPVEHVEQERMPNGAYVGDTAVAPAPEEI